MDLYGWDVICAVAVVRLNELLAQQFAKNPAALSYKDDSVDIEAQFSPWRLVAGGSLKKLHFAMPITSGTVRMPGCQVDLSGVTPIVELELAFLDNSSTSSTDLKFNLQVASSTPGDSTPGSVSVITGDSTGVLANKPNGPAAGMALSDNFAKCLIANRDKLGYIFASLNLTPTGDGAWLVPRHPAYTYVQGGNGNADSQAPGYIPIVPPLDPPPVPPKSQDYLAIFSVASDRDTSALPRNIDPGICDGTSDVCVAYAKSIFLAHVIKPQLPQAYPGTSDANFVLSPDGNTIVNNGSIAMKEVDHWGTGYHPHIDGLSIGVSGGTITTSVNGAFDITGLSGAYTNFGVSQNAHLQFDVGSKTVSIARDGDPSHSIDTEVPWYDYAAAGAFGLIITAIVDSVIKLVTDAVSNEVDSSNVSTSGNMPMATWTAAAFQFPGIGQWTVLNCLLSDAFSIRCTLTKPTTPVPPAIPHAGEWKSRRCEVADWFGGGH